MSIAAWARVSSSGVGLRQCRRRRDLRRSFVTISRREGESERAIMQISGHKTRAVFDRYDAYDLRDVILFRERREATRALRGQVRKGPHRVTPDHHTPAMQEQIENKA